MQMKVIHKAHLAGLEGAGRYRKVSSLRALRKYTYFFKEKAVSRARWCLEYLITFNLQAC